MEKYRTLGESKIIRKISDLIRKKIDNLANWLTLEVGKPLLEAKGEINGAADIFEWNSEETKRIYGQSIQVDFQTLGYKYIINLLVL